jgi:hypothetical protein
MEEQTIAAADVAVEAASAEFVGRWNRLVSTTNWEKGKIICQWREALRASGATSDSYGDEAWSRQVGGVSPQHVGRLRRVHERFGETYEQYPGLYWSHFLAALDWSDAEMYLEGAVQCRWSVSEMCEKRREAIGGPPADDSADADEVEWDEGDACGEAAAARRPSPVIEDTIADVRGTEADETASPARQPSPIAEEPTVAVEAAADEPPAIRPFAALPPLPPDLNEAFEAMKLAILGHKVAGWQEISRADVLAMLDALRQLALAPA